MIWSAIRRGRRQTFQRIYQRCDLLKTSVEKLAREWQQAIARAREEGHPITSAGDNSTIMELHHPVIVLEELARTQGVLGMATAALETWQ